MAFVIEKDMGEGNAPAFLEKTPEGILVWGKLAKAFNFPTEADAIAYRDQDVCLMGCIVVPNDETLISASNVKTVEIASGMEPDFNINR